MQTGQSAERADCPSFIDASSYQLTWGAFVSEDVDDEGLDEEEEDDDEEEAGDEEEEEVCEVVPACPHSK